MLVLVVEPVELEMLLLVLLVEVNLEVDHHPSVEACRTITDLMRRIRRTTGSAAPCKVGRMCGSRTGFVEL